MATRLVSQRNGLKITDFWLRAVAGADSGEPFAGIKAFGRLLAFPHINAARYLAVASADELFPQKSRNFEEIRSGEMMGR